MLPLTDPNERALSAGSGQVPVGGFAALVPKLSVVDLDAGLRFWCDLLGFTVAYDRPAARFAYLTLGEAQVMLCQHNGRWQTGALEPPLGRGVNFSIETDRMEATLAALLAARWPLYEPPSEAWYRVGTTERGQRECLVQDPDGYLVRLTEGLGERPAA